jgi:replicative DNA helicase
MGYSSLELEEAVISKMITGAQVERGMAEGLQREHFANRTSADVWTFAIDYTIQYGSCPSASLVQHLYPDCRIGVITDSLDYLLMMFKREIKRRYVSQALEDIAIAMQDPRNLDNIEDLVLQRSMKAIELMPAGEVMRFSDMRKRIDDYQVRLAAGQEPVGIRIGLATIDQATFGIQPSDFVSISGWQGTGKTTLGLFTLWSAYLQGFTPMIFSIEMDGDQLMRRWDTMATHVNYERMKGLNLTPEEFSKWESAADAADKFKSDIIVLDAIGGATVDFVFAKMQAYKPDLVLIDYISLLTPPRRGEIWQEVTAITQSLKQIARRSKTPIIGIAQTNINSAKAGAGLDNISYSRSIGQDSDIAIGLHQDENMRERSQMEVRLMKNRDGRQLTTKMLWKPETMTFDEWTFADEIRSNPGVDTGADESAD